MKLSVSQLRRIIKEEVSRMLRENEGGPQEDQVKVINDLLTGKEEDEPEGPKELKKAIIRLNRKAFNAYKAFGNMMGNLNIAKALFGRRLDILAMFNSLIGKTMDNVKIMNNDEKEIKQEAEDFINGQIEELKRLLKKIKPDSEGKIMLGDIIDHDLKNPGEYPLLDSVSNRALQITEKLDDLIERMKPI